MLKPNSRLGQFKRTPEPFQIKLAVLNWFKRRTFHVLKKKKKKKIWVSKETVVLRRWEIETEIYFIKRVDKSRMATVKDLESWRFER